MRARWAVVVMGVTACGGDGGEPPVVGCEPGAFVGEWTTVRVADGGEVITAVDLSEASVSAVVDGGARELAGVGFVGGFRIRDVPSSAGAGEPILVRVQEVGSPPVYDLTRACSWDRQELVIGTEAPHATSDATTVDVDVDGLLVWRGGDALTVVMPRFWDRFRLDTSAVELGVRFARGLRDDAARWPLLDVLDVGLGSVFQTGEHALDQIGPFTWISTLDAGGALEPFTLTEGATARAHATLEPLVQNQRLTVDLDGFAFEVLGEEAGLSPVQLIVSVGALPRGGCGARPLPLVTVHAPSHQRSVLDHPYADPFPEEAWTRRACVLVPFDAEAGSAYAQDSLLEDLEARPLVPLLSAPQTWAIDGLDARATTTTAIGETPTLSWTPPALGTVSEYGVGVDLVEQVIDGPSLVTRRTAVATFRIEGSTELTLPQGILAPGLTYELTLEARTVEASLSLRSVPFVVAP